MHIDVALTPDAEMVLLTVRNGQAPSLTERIPALEAMHLSHTIAMQALSVLRAQAHKREHAENIQS